METEMQKFRCYLAGLLVVTLTAFSAQAELIGFRFEGVGIFWGPTWNGLEIPNQLNGEFFYDTSTPDSDPHPYLGSYAPNRPGPWLIRYRSGPVSEEFQIRRISVGDSLRGAPDTFQIEAIDEHISANVAIFSLSYIPTTFLNDSLPVSLPFAGFDGSSYERRYLLIGHYGGDFSEEQLAMITSISAVPLPPALPLFVAALLAMGLFGWHRRKRQY